MSEIRWPVRERDPLMRAVRWAAVGSMLLAAALRISQLPGFREVSKVLNHMLGNAYEISGILLMGSLTSLAVVVLLCPPGERRAANWLLAIILLLMSFIAVVPYFFSHIIYPYRSGEVTPTLKLVDIWCLLILLVSSGAGIVMSKKWATWPILAGIILVGAFYFMRFTTLPQNEGLFSTEQRVEVSIHAVTMAHGGARTAVSVVQYLQPIPYVLALFVIALVHSTRDRVIAWWLRRRVLGESKNR
ncbi:MAG: hypothetical protein K1Y02_08295 [Candidatus Hydrogenedentes bacterium]|nr:hypothetical protein [Candidatus Hydrogenedentota bacterium]